MNKKVLENRLGVRAQLEMIGLIIIVIIVITSLLIFTVYKISNPHRRIQSRYMNKAIATNMLISITKTNVEECHNISLAELIIDCAKTYHTITCYDYTSCEVANKTIFNILNKTLIDWEMSFNLSIEKTPISFVNLGCTSRVKEKVQGFEVLSLYPNQTGNPQSKVDITLDICTRR